MYLFTSRPSRLPHPHRTPMALTFLALLLVGISLFSTDAYAEHRDMTVDLQAVDVSLHHGALTVDYAIERADWRRLRHAGIQPRLYLYDVGHRGRDTYLYSVRIDRRQGRVSYPRRVTPHHAKRVKLRLVGRHRGVRIARTRYGSACGDRVSVAVHRGHQAPRRHRRKPRHRPAPPAWRADLAKACSSATFSSNDVAECVEAGSPLRAGAAKVVAACDDATYSTSDLVSCVQKSSRLTRHRVAVVRSCSEKTYWSDDFEQCLTNVAAYRRDPVPVIEACADATQWSDAFQGCLREARGLGYEAASVVRACGEGTSWDDAFRSCIRASAS